MKKYLISMMSLLAFAACGGDDKGGETPSGGSLSVDFTFSQESAYTGEEITVTPNIKGGKAPFTYAWDFGNETTSTDAAATVAYDKADVYLVKLTVTDANNAKGSKTRVFQVTAAPVMDKGDLKIEWYVDFNDNAKVRGSVPAVDDNGNVYIAASVDADGRLYQVSADGTTTKSVSLNPSTGNTCGSPSIDAGGNVYCGAGSGSGGSYHKYTDMSVAWALTDCANGTANPKIWYGAPVILGDGNILLANAGGTGSVGAATEAGERTGYVTSMTGKGPSGGCRQSPAVSNDGYVWQACAAKGVIGVELSALVQAGGHTYDWFVGDINSDGKGSANETYNMSLSSSNGDRPAQAVVSVGGVNYCVGLCVPAGYAQVYKISRTGEVATFVIDGTNTSIENISVQDQGGVIIGTNNEIIVNLKAGGSKPDGGIVAVDPATMTLAWEYRTTESVAAAPALTKEGYVAFGTDEGIFYVVNPANLDENKTPELIAKATINEMIVAKGLVPASEESFNIKMWSGVTIGDDGKLYIGFTKEDGGNNSAGLLCLSSSKITGAGASQWPMMGVDRKHTGVQKK